jgi:hypothetical protein
MPRAEKVLLSIALFSASAALCGCPLIAGVDHDYTSSGAVPDAAMPDGTSPVGDAGMDGHTVGDTGHPTDGRVGDSRRDGPSPGQDAGDAGDSGTPPSDAADGMAPPVDSGVDACPAACSVPETAGWTLVAYDPTGTSTCPSGFTAITVDTPTGAGSCACSGCGVMTNPDCESGQVATMIGSSCGTIGPSYPANSGQCSPGSIGPATSSTFTAPAPGGGGTCSATATPTNPSVDQGIMCTSAPSTCATAVCEDEFKGVGSKFKTCLYQAGDQTCPAGATGTKHAVGATVTTACDTCSCTVNATGCSGLFHIYSSAAGCTGTPVFTASTGGSCEALSGVASGDSYLYTAAATGVTCTNGTSNATDTVNSPGTICCP